MYSESAEPATASPVIAEALTNDGDTVFILVSIPSISAKCVSYSAWNTNRYQCALGNWVWPEGFTPPISVNISDKLNRMRVTEQELESALIAVPVHVPGRKPLDVPKAAADSSKIGMDVILWSPSPYLTPLANSLVNCIGTLTEEGEIIVDCWTLAAATCFELNKKTVWRYHEGISFD